MKKNNLHYAWVVLAGLFILSSGMGFQTNANSLFNKVVPDALGFSLSEYTSMNMLRHLLQIPMIPLFSRLFSRYSQRAIMLVCAVGSSAGFYLFALAQTRLQFWILSIVTGIFSAGVCTYCVCLAVSKWFVKYRSLANGIAISGASFFPAVAIPIGLSIVEKYGWTYGFRSFGAAGLAFMLLALLLIRDKPGDMHTVRFGEEGEYGEGPVSVSGVPKKAALRSPVMWLYLASVWLWSLISMGILQQVITFLTSIGYTSELGASISSIALTGMIFMKIIVGRLADRFGPKFSVIYMTVALAGTNVVLLLCGVSPAMPYLFAVCLMSTYPVVTIHTTYFASYLFGDLDYTALYGYGSTVCAAACAMGQMAPGWIYDISGSFYTAWWVFLALSLVCGALMALALKLLPELRKQSVTMQVPNART